MSQFTISDVLEPFDERLGNRIEPPVLTLTEKKGFVSQVERFNKRLATDDTSKYKLIRRGDVAFNPYLLWAGAIATNMDWDDAIISPAYPTFHTREDFDPSFIKWLLGGEPIRLYYDSISFGAVPRRRRAKTEDFLELRLPHLPPLSEQKRIAAILDTADALRTKRQAALAKLDDLVQATFLDMFGDPVTNPKGWEVDFLGAVCDKITDGTHHSPPIQEEGVPYVTAKHLKQEGLKFFENPWYVSQEDHDAIFSRCDPKKGDVLYIKDGATTGIAAINQYDFPFSMLSSLALLRPKTNKFLSEYLCHYLNNERNKTHLMGNMGGAAIKRLTLAKIKKFVIPLPPLALQQQFASIVTKIEEQKSRMRTHLAELDTLFASLQSRAFKGEL